MKTHKPEFFADEIRKVFVNTFDAWELIHKDLEISNSPADSSLCLTGFKGNDKYRYDFKISELVEWQEEDVLSLRLTDIRDFLLSLK